MNNQNLGNNIINWIKTHKFWTSVILLGVTVIAFRTFGYPSLTFGLFYNLLLWYVLVGGLIWSGYTNKKGMTFITLGIVLALMVLFPWMRTSKGATFGIEGYALIIGEILMSILFIWIGTKRYKHWLRNQEV